MAGGGFDDGEIPWSEVQYRKNKRSRPDGVEMTFLVQNLPNGVSKSLLWRAFQPHGFITDAYVARKKDARGGCFGFVRYVVVGKLEEVLKNMNTVKIFDAKPTVILAKYDKNHKRFIYTSELRGEEIWRPKVSVQKQIPIPMINKQPNEAGPSNSAFRCGDVMFSDLFRNTGDTKENRKVVEIEGRGVIYPNHCIMRAVIGEALDVAAVKNIQEMLDKGGYNECPVSHIGGLMFMVVFREKRLALEFIQRKDLWGDVLTSAELWEGEHLEFNRLAWIKILGVPLQICENKVFDKIGEAFGKVVRKSEFSWDVPDNSGATCGVITKSGLRINEEIVVRWNGKDHPVWILEVENEILQSSVKVLSDAYREAPVASAESVLNEEVEMEEGEIPVDVQAAQGDNNGEVPETVHGSPENEEVPRVQGVHELSRQMHGEEVGAGHVEQTPRREENYSGDLQESRIKEFIDPVEELDGGKMNGSVMGNQEGPRDMGQSSHALHGEFELVGDAQKDYIYEVRTTIADVHQKEVGLDIGCNVGSVNGVHGPTQSFNPTLTSALGKRPRNTRSPPSGDSTQGPPIRVFSQNQFGENYCFDLNSPADISRTAAITNSNPAIEEDVAQQTRSNGLEGSSQSSAALRSKCPNQEKFLSTETDATIDVGTKVGIDLQGFHSNTKELIEGEGGFDVVQ
ncbi:putative RNA recognition motif domain, nucleotide-binding alpha-beta plait domain superfamily [Helianthus annuus]|nr:putative RNA recognition motif domain, nucleotide-binding alpha-beta plait domain superfamily [Helianthus annuus]KAJ0878007.1 putative RNA recognition motif domain, nucleotide-binding alpha-beta plait domain superfamily [Helianthus annuus]KAJ0954092.1 putative RNA recognition motif domain, nucleotide-binding alpha-beta plait domain superfamily [Helianthus annuus]